MFLEEELTIKNKNKIGKIGTPTQLWKMYSHKPSPTKTPPKNPQLAKEHPPNHGRNYIKKLSLTKSPNQQISTKKLNLHPFPP